MNWKIFLCVLASLIMMACGDLEAGNEQLLDQDGGTVHVICDPGRQVECACVGGQKGAQICAIDGTHYLGCQCPQIDAGSEPVKCSGSFDPGTVMSTGCGENGQQQGCTVCLLDGTWSPCYLCGSSLKDGGVDAQPEADSNVLPNLEVSLDPNTPAGANLCQNASDVQAFSFMLTATGAKVTTKGIRIQRVGVGQVSDITELRLEASSVYFTGSLVNSNKGIWYFDTPGIQTQMGNPTKLVLHASFNGTPTGQHAFQITDVSSLDLLNQATLSGSFPVKGNTFTINNAKCSWFAMTPASNPVSSTAVKKSQNVDVLGIQLTAGVNDVMLKSLPLKCQASIHGAPYSAANCWERITSLTVFDGNTQVGYSISPNTDGKAPILPNYLVPNGTTKTLTVKASLASTASADQPYDKVSVGVDQYVLATDMVYNQNVTPDVSTTLTTVQLSQDPAVAITILPSGTLSIVEDGHPAMQIVVAGQDYWTPFANYRAMSQYEAMSLDRIRVTHPDGGDNADFDQVAIASGGTVRGTAIFPAGKTGSVDVDISSNPILVPKDGNVSFQIWAKLAPVQPSSVGTDGVARSGDSPRLGLASEYTIGEWTPSYSDNLNVRSTGQVSGERVYALAGAGPGNAMVIRKTKPMVTKQNLVTNVLSNVDMQLARLIVGANANGGPVALKQLVFSVAKDKATSVSNIRLRRGATEVPTSEYQAMVCQDILDGQVPSCKGGQFTVGSSSGNIRIVFANEDIITGSGYLYTLHALIGGSIPGSSIALSLQGPSDADVVTGYQMQLPPLDWQQAVCTDLQSINSCHSAGFLWSDQSEQPHSGATFDWTNGYLVEDVQNAFWILTS